MNNTPFAEIEIDASQSRSSFEKHALRLNLPVSRPQPIEPREVDPVRMKFYEMRKLASARPFPRTDSEVFYKQAKFMEDFTDNYEGVANLNMYYPYYQNMGYDYLRTYFTWRTKLRNGELLPTSLSYIFLYIYELLSGIGVSNPADGLNKLLTIWYSLAKGTPSIEKHLVKWFKDYHIFYELPHSFVDFTAKHDLRKYYNLTFLFDESVENKLVLWNGISGYNVTNSKFYNDGNRELFSDCFIAVLQGIQEFCAERKTRFEDMFVYSVSKRRAWQPFEQALFKSEYAQADRELFLSDFERYYCKNGEWTATKPIYYSGQRDFVGYIIKKTEACLRKITKYKYKLVADLKPGTQPFRELKRMTTNRAELDKVVERAVEKFHFELTRTVVSVDFDNLKKIRSEALETQEQLIVPEDTPPALAGIDAHKSCHPGQSEESRSKKEHPDKATGIMHIPAIEIEPTELTMNFSDGWGALKEALTDTEIEAIAIAMNEGNVKAFADKQGIMLEILVDGINEKAADYIGDSVMELGEEVYVYDEYKEHLEKW